MIMIHDLNMQGFRVPTPWVPSRPCDDDRPPPFPKMSRTCRDMSFLFQDDSTPRNARESLLKRVKKKKKKEKGRVIRFSASRLFLNKRIFGSWPLVAGPNHPGADVLGPPHHPSSAELPSQSSETTGEQTAASVRD